MTGTIEEFNKLVDAEEFLNFFKLPYDQEVVNVKLSTKAICPGCANTMLPKIA